MLANIQSLLRSPLSQYLQNITPQLICKHTFTDFAHQHPLYLAMSEAPEFKINMSDLSLYRYEEVLVDYDDSYLEIETSDNLEKLSRSRDRRLST
jgi:hypothetical protein